MCHRSCRAGGCGCSQRGRIDKTDPNDARSAAIVAWRTPALNIVTASDEHRVMLRLLADSDHQITAQRTRSICRLHALLCLLIEGGTGRSLTVTRAEELLASVHVDGSITTERIATARQLLDEVRVLDTAHVEVRRRHVTALEASKTTVTEVFGIGSLMAAIIVGRVGDVRRFPTSGHFARHNGTAPIEASSGPREKSTPVEPSRGPTVEPRHPHGCRHPGPQRHTGPRLLPSQASRGEVTQGSFHALKRRISDAVYPTSPRRR